MNPDDMVRIAAVVPDDADVEEFMDAMCDYAHRYWVDGCLDGGDARIWVGGANTKKRTVTSLALPEYVPHAMRWLEAHGATITGIERA